jgi:hypothetical protein
MASQISQCLLDSYEPFLLASSWLCRTTSLVDHTINPHKSSRLPQHDRRPMDTIPAIFATLLAQVDVDWKHMSVPWHLRANR